MLDEAPVEPTPNEDSKEKDSALSGEGGKSYLPLALSMTVVVALADQLTKLWALSALSDKGSIPVIGDFFRLTLVYNYGGAMGTNFGGPVIYLLMGLVILGFLLYYLWAHRHILWFALPLGLIAGGAVGNLVDRIRLGKVVDWIDVDFFDISLPGLQIERWWTFNVADAAISVSLLYLIWAFLLGPAKTRGPATTEEPEKTKPNAVPDFSAAPEKDSDESM